jgi:excisionase family DNA binding protein
MRPGLTLTSTETADLLRVHPSTVKRWCNDGDLSFGVTPGGHRRIRLGDAVDFARARGIRTVLTPFRPFEAHVWSALRALDEDGGHEKLSELAMHWVRRGDFPRLEQLLLAVARSGLQSFVDFCDHTVRGLMADVGREWEAGRLRVGDEHMTSHSLLEVLAALRRDRQEEEESESRREGPVAVVGAVEGNQHYLGASCVRLLLERMGWRVFFPGPDVPIEDFGVLQMSREASLVCISLPPGAVLGDVTRVLAILREFYDRGRPYALALGGSLPVGSGSSTATPFEAMELFDSVGGLEAAVSAGFGSAGVRA